MPVFVCLFDCSCVCLYVCLFRKLLVFFVFFLLFCLYVCLLFVCLFFGFACVWLTFSRRARWPIWMFNKIKRFEIPPRVGDCFSKELVPTFDVDGVICIYIQL